MSNQEMQKLWKQKLKKKLTDTTQLKLGNILSSYETETEISKIVSALCEECNISETEDVKIKFKLNIDILETDVAEQQLVSDFSSDGCVYYLKCPDGSGRPCWRC